MGKLEGKVAVITGGNSGIGFAVAKTFSDHGAKVVIFGRDAETLHKANMALTGESMFIKGDVCSQEDLEKLFRETREYFGVVDIVVANAGGAIMRPFLEVTEDDFNYLSDVNFKGVFFTLQKAVPFMNDGGAAIIVSSSANCRAVPDMSVYGSAKAAVRALARTLTQELAPREIRVNVLTPGPVMTAAYSRTGLSEDQITDFQAMQASQIPLKRIGQPDEIAAAALFLASQDSSFVAGAELVADGGMTQI